MKFKKEWLQALLDKRHKEAEIVENALSDHTRWLVCYSFVFKFEGKYYSAPYSMGATESQDEYPWEYDGDEVKCREVRPVEVTVTKYETAG